MLRRVYENICMLYNLSGELDDVLYSTSAFCVGALRS